MNSSDFEFLSGLLKKRSGLFLTADKEGFLESRLKLVAARHGFKALPLLVRELRAGNEALARAVTFATTTHDTGFFRDPATFQSFRGTVLPAMLDTRGASRRLRIWCAGVATGQEAYSVAMSVDGAEQFADWQVQILATDINADIIERAKEGRFAQFEMMRGLPIQMLAKYFRTEGEDWRVKKSLRERVEFRVSNLIEPFAALGEFDVIFCRNVLIYFDPRTKEDVMKRLCDVLAHDGYLALGVSETTVGLTTALSEVSATRAIYTKAKAAPRRRAALG